jgi:hypothetical protein
VGLPALAREEYDSAVTLFGKSLMFTDARELPPASRTLAFLAHIMVKLGEEAFARVWRLAFNGENPPLERIRAAAELMRREDSQKQT